MTVLPFREFLDVLRAKGLGVSLHEHLAVGRLLERWEPTSRDEFRDALAALIARNEDEIRAIRALFDDFYRTESAVAADQGGTGEQARRYRLVHLLTTGRWWLAAVTATALAFAPALAYWLYQPDGLVLPSDAAIARAGPALPWPLPVPDPVPPPPGPIVDETLIQPAAEPLASALPPLPSRVDWSLVAWLATAALAVSFVSLWTVRVRARARSWTADAWQSALAALPGPYHPRLVLNDLVTRLPRRDVEDAATILARTFSGIGSRRELDVARSLRDTLRFGLRPALVFRRRRVQQPILVLQDVSQVMAPHASRVEHLLADLRRQGVLLERWYFDGDVSIAAERRDGPPIPLEVLAKRREDWPLMIVSAGFGVPATLTLANRAWLGGLRSWTRRVWLNPIRDPQLWPSALGRLPITALPISRSGLIAAATMLAQGEQEAAGLVDRARETSRPVTVAHVERLKRLASVVPHPTVDELELLRQRFAPDVPESAVLHTATDLGTHAGAPLRMSDGEIRDYLHQLRRETPGLEVDVRRYLLHVLRDSEPVAGSAAHARWELAVALHRAQIATLSSSADAAPAMSELSRLAHGPLWSELRAALDRLPEADTATRAIARAAGGRDEPPAFEDRTGRLAVRTFRWGGPQWRDVTAAMAVAAIVALAGSFSSSFRLQASHAPDAYVLAYRPAAAGPGELVVRARNPDSPIPRTVRVYRDGEPFGGPIDLDLREGTAVPIEAADTAHVYQARADLPGGALALSNTIWAPSVVVVIDAQPWARVTVRSRDGSVPDVTGTTPAAFRLPEGEYDLALENDGLTAPLERQIRVSSTGDRYFRFDMPGFDPGQLIDDLGLTPSRPPAAAY